MIKIATRLSLVFLFFLAGCKVAGPQKEAAVMAPPKTEQQIVKELEQRYKNAVSFKANGQCSFFYNYKDKSHKENFPVQLWINPPSEIYMQGDVAFNAKGIVLGSNEKEFWLALEPKEISSYWWGKWSQQDSVGTMLINPKVVLEAFGFIKIDDDKNLTFKKEDSRVVLINKQDDKIKRIYISQKDGFVRRIEYVGVQGESLTIAELDKYISVSTANFIPTEIKIIRRVTNDAQGTININLKLSSAKITNFTAEQRQFLFNRRPMEGFKHIYEIFNGKAIEKK